MVEQCLLRETGQARRRQYTARPLQCVCQSTQPFCVQCFSVLLLLQLPALLLLPWSVMHDQPALVQPSRPWRRNQAWHVCFFLCVYVFFYGANATDARSMTCRRLLALQLVLAC